MIFYERHCLGHDFGDLVRRYGRNSPDGHFGHVVISLEAHKPVVTCGMSFEGRVAPGRHQIPGVEIGPFGVRRAGILTESIGLSRAVGPVGVASVIGSGVFVVPAGIADQQHKPRPRRLPVLPDVLEKAANALRMNDTVVELVKHVLHVDDFDCESALTVELGQGLYRFHQTAMRDHEVVRLVAGCAELGWCVDHNGIWREERLLCAHIEFFLVIRQDERDLFAMGGLRSEEMTPASRDHGGARICGRRQPNGTGRGCRHHDDLCLIGADLCAPRVPDLDPVQQHDVDDRITGTWKAPFRHLHDHRAVITLDPADRNLEIQHVALLTIPLPCVEDLTIEGHFDAVVLDVVRFGSETRPALEGHSDREVPTLCAVHVAEVQDLLERFGPHSGQLGPVPDLSLLIGAL